MHRSCGRRLRAPRRAARVRPGRGCPFRVRADRARAGSPETPPRHGRRSRVPPERQLRRAVHDQAHAGAVGGFRLDDLQMIPRHDIPALGVRVVRKRSQGGFERHELVPLGTHRKQAGRQSFLVVQAELRVPIAAQCADEAAIPCHITQLRLEDANQRCPLISPPLGCRRGIRSQPTAHTKRTSAARRRQDQRFLQSLSRRRLSPSDSPLLPKRSPLKFSSYSTN